MTRYEIRMTIWTLMLITLIAFSVVSAVIRI